MTAYEKLFGRCKQTIPYTDCRGRGRTLCDPAGRSGAQMCIRDSLIDVEMFTGDEIVKQIIESAHAAGVKVVASNHDFFKTPDKDCLLYTSRCV